MELLAETMKLMDKNAETMMITDRNEIFKGSYTVLHIIIFPTGTLIVIFKASQ